jgi:predicted metal-dependent phosphoesterase TrpH
MRNKFILVVFLFFALIQSGAQDRDIQFQMLRGFQKVDARNEIRIPDIMGFKTLKCDFHMHTIFSDGVVLPSERVHEAWREGLDAIAITDHTTPQPRYLIADYNTSWRMARDVAVRRGITLIQATEYTKSEPVGHLNILFIDDANPFRGDSLSTDQAMYLAKDMGAFVIYNHPGWPDKNSELDSFHVHHIENGRIQGMEVFNGGEFYPVVMDYVNQYGVAPFSNTDIHGPIHGSFDVDNKHRNLTLVFAEDNSEPAIKEALFAKRTVAFAGNTLVGKSLFLMELLRSSLQVSNLHVTETGFSCDVKNISDITWYLDGEGHKYLTFPANRTVQLRESMNSAELTFRVANTYISSGRHLEIPLAFLLAARDEVIMPFSASNVNGIPAGSKVELTSPTPDAEIRYTLDGSEPNQESALYSSPLIVSKSVVLTARAFKQGMKPSRIWSRQILVDVPHDPVRISGSEQGLYYRYYEGKFLSARHVEPTGRFVREGTVSFPDVSVADADDYFGFVFSGYIFAPENGLYTFTLESDDGAILKVAGVELVNNDGSHSLKRAKGSMRLKKGYHAFDLLYFDDYDEQELRLFWEAPGKQEQLIDPSFYYRK